jgi:alpha-L-rhamnosidase
MKKVYFLLCFMVQVGFAQTDYTREAWSAEWITAPGSSPYDYGVYLFRKSVQLSAVPKEYKVHVSADNRFELFVNGVWVGFGPARGDIAHWNYETYDLAQYLKAGNNWLAARVWNEGDFRPEAQISARTGFLLQGVTDPLVSTGGSWEARQDKSYSPLPLKVPFYYVSGPGEVRRYSEYEPGWDQGAGVAWAKAKSIARALPNSIVGGYGTTNIWMLQPSILPVLERKEEKIEKVVWAKGIPSSTVPQRGQPLTVPKDRKVELLLDQGHLINAYPVLQFSGGSGARISLSYAEALYDEQMKKGNRNEVLGKRFIGRKDSLVVAGRKSEVFRPYSYRTYRYLKLEVETGDEALVLEDLHSLFVGYPFKMEAQISSDLPEMQEMLKVGWRTARLCAMDTYMDCPYYEQLQYIGDARIQALVSLYNSGDDRLVKNALNLMDQSRRPEGVTLSRHPSYTPQYIPTFSLWYIGMLHDYLRYGSDEEFVREKLGGVHQILQYFQRYQGKGGTLKGVPQWTFTDWVSDRDWVSGVGPKGKDGGSAMLDLQLLYAYQVAIQLEEDLGVSIYKNSYAERVSALKASIWQRYWVGSRGLFADREERDVFSQHTNALAILTGMLDEEEERKVAGKLTSDSTLSKASIYFKYYLHRALVKAGRGNEYMQFLDHWRENLNMGLSTWAEMSDVSGSRSDCHAWGSSPNIEFYRVMLGIDSDAPGFRKVVIRPHLGELLQLEGSIPHPEGRIAAAYRKDAEGWQVRIVLPGTVSGKFIFGGQVRELQAGVNTFFITNSN